MSSSFVFDDLVTEFSLDYRVPYTSASLVLLSGVQVALDYYANGTSPDPFRCLSEHSDLVSGLSTSLSLPLDLVSGLFGDAIMLVRSFPPAVARSFSSFLLTSSFVE